MGKLTVVAAWLLIGLAVVWTGLTITDLVSHRRRPTVPYRTAPGIGGQLRTGRLLVNDPAGVQVTVFSDYECSACNALMKRLDRIRKKGDVPLAVALRHFPIPIHPYAFKAAIAAECAARQEMFEPYHRALFDAQDSLGRIGWSVLAVRAGVQDTTTFTQCLSDSSAANVVLADAQEAASVQVRATPIIVVGDEVYWGLPWDLEAILKRHHNTGQRPKS